MLNPWTGSSCLRALSTKVALLLEAHQLCLPLRTDALVATSHGVDEAEKKQRAEISPLGSVVVPCVRSDPDQTQNEILCVLLP